VPIKASHTLRIVLGTPAIYYTTENFYGLRYWPTWLGVIVMRILSLLPLPLLYYIGGLFGDVLRVCVPSRRRIASRNLELCFPNLSALDHKLLLRRNFRNTARMFLLSGFVWWGTKKAFDRRIKFTNEHYLVNAKKEGRGVILLAPHFVAMEVAGMYVSSRYPSVSIYQNNRNKVLDKLMLQARSRFGGQMFERKSDLKSLIRSIRDGKVCYYLPDQDPGPRRAVFAPFFNVPTATWPVLGRMARMTRAVVVPCTTRIIAGGRGFEVILDPPLENFPTGDKQLDSEAMNRAIEQCVSRLPDQYFWVHKRFKTRPPGSEDIY